LDSDWDMGFGQAEGDNTEDDCSMQDEEYGPVSPSQLELIFNVLKQLYKDIRAVVGDSQQYRAKYLSDIQ